MGIEKILKKFIGFRTNFSSLTIVGVGPGDPSLLTISAVNAIKNADVIFYPISSDEKKSLAAEIVKEYIKFKKKIPFIFPMARKAYDPDEIWLNAVNLIVKCLENNESVVLLCLGDTSLFASSSNILRIIKIHYPKIITKTIPGISSISAAAALSDFDLVKEDETLIIKEFPSSEAQLKALLVQGKLSKQVLALMKVGKRWSFAKEILQKENIIEKSLIALNVGMSNQIIQNASKYNKETMPYFSLILIRF